MTSSERLLSVAEVAWLCRVNDATVRSWMRVGRNGRQLATKDDGRVSWGDLTDFSAGHRTPLDPEWLKINATDPLPSQWRSAELGGASAMAPDREADLLARIADLQQTGLALLRMNEAALPVLGQRLIDDALDR